MRTKVILDEKWNIIIKEAINASKSAVSIFVKEFKEHIFIVAYHNVSFALFGFEK